MNAVIRELGHGFGGFLENLVCAIFGERGFFVLKIFRLSLICVEAAIVERR
jgi:hypothetical protein